MLFTVSLHKSSLKSLHTKLKARHLEEKIERIIKILAELKDCINSRNLGRGKIIHEAATQAADDSNVYVSNTLIHMYAKCGNMDLARRTFHNMKQTDVVSWNALIFGYAENGENFVALELFSRMGYHGYEPNARTFVAALKACKDISGKDDVYEFRHIGRMLELLALRFFCNSDIFIQGTLVNMHAKKGCMVQARWVFENIKQADVVSWNALILGYADNEDAAQAVAMFARMKSFGTVPNPRTFVAAFKACADLAVDENVVFVGKALHMIASRSGCDQDIYVQDTLVDMYSKCRTMVEAQKVFDGMKLRNVVSWTVLMMGYVDNGNGEVALSLFSRLEKEDCTPNAVTFLAALKACVDIAVKEEGNHRVILENGKQIHLLASMSGWDSDIYVEDCLVDMYAKCKSMDDASNVFEGIRNANVVSWTAFILGYADNGDGGTALEVFWKMRCERCVPNSRTFVAALKACANIAVEYKGRATHLLASRYGFDSNIFVQDSLVDMYAKCGSTTDSRRVFDLIEHPTVVSWTALILGYVDNQECAMALSMFLSMQRWGCTPNERTYVAALKACSIMGALLFARSVHAEIINRGVEIDGILANALLDIYAKCGSLIEAKLLFDSYNVKNVVTWNVLITGYCRAGDTTSVFVLFDSLCDAGLKPDDITFVCVLTACSHAGLVEKGLDYFTAMSNKHGVTPGLEHYTCMIDVLGRANKLEDAMELVRRMPLSADAVTWVTIQGACWKWKLRELGNLAFESLMVLDDRNAAAYVLMASSSRHS